MDTKIEINAEELPFIREKLMKCKVIALDSMDKHPLINPRLFPKNEKDKLLKKVREIFDTNSIDDINLKFNTICCERLFASGLDYSNYPVYVDNRFPQQQEKIDLEEPELEKLKEEIKTNKLIVQDIAGNILEVEDK
jgi:hypothetical protein